MDNLELVKKLITEKLQDAKVEVTDMTGTRDHLEILVASDAFAGKSLLQQHQVVMDILREALSGPVHAVKLKTMTKDRYQTTAKG